MGTGAANHNFLLLGNHNLVPGNRRQNVFASGSVWGLTATGRVEWLPGMYFPKLQAATEDMHILLLVKVTSKNTNGASAVF